MGIGAFFIPAIMNVENNRNGGDKSDHIQPLTVAAD
jgi:hypothetical protein